MSAAFYNSILFRFFLLCADLYRGSLICRALDSLDEAVPRWLTGSAAAGFLRRDGALVRAWPGSLLAAVLGGIVNLPVALARTVYRPCRRVLEGSLFWRFTAWLGQNTAVLTGLFLMVMLCVPHSSWNNVYGFAGALALGALFVLACARGELKFELTRLGPWFCFFLLTVGIALFTSWSTRLSLRFFLFYVGAFLFTLLLVSAMRSQEQLLGVLTALAFGLLVCGLFGAYQLYTGVEIVYSQQDMFVNQGMPGRIYSFFDNPNNFAEILVMLLPLTLALLLVTKNWRVRLLSAAALAVGVVSLGATYGRSCWIGAAVSLVVFLFLVNWRLLPLAALGGIFCLPLLPETIFNRLLTIGNTNDSSLSYRFYIYDATFTMLKDFWFSGTGLGTDAMVKVFHLYQPMPDGNFPLHTHNNYLQMWAELGILGGVFHLGTMLGQVKRGVKGYYAARDSRTVRIILAGAVGALCGILVVCLAEYTWYYPRNLFFFWSLFGIVSACVKLLEQPGGTLRAARS